MKLKFIKVLVFIYFNIPNLKRLRKSLECLIARLDGGPRYSSQLREIYKRRYHIIVGYGTGSGALCPGNMPRSKPEESLITFGNYCSIAMQIKIYRANHPIESFSMHPLLYNPALKYVRTHTLKHTPLTIGHDVWIGADAIILSNCKNIGNGAVVGAGSIVTKDIPPYAIVAGNPAKVIKMRFSEDIIQKLEATQWWNMNKEELVKNREKLEEIVRGK